MSNVTYDITNSKLGQAKCLNCGDTWGSHAGIYCRRGEDPQTFHPFGFSLSDRCDNCGEMLVDHRKRAICKGDETSFSNDNLFKEEDFLL